MTDKNSGSGNSTAARGKEEPGSLRERAEDHISSAREDGEAGKAGLPEGEVFSGYSETRLRHELNVHQIELEMQNEELLRSHAELQDARSYLEGLFNNSPVAYVTLSNRDTIRESNKAADDLLSFPQGLQGTSLLPFISPRHHAMLSTTLDRALRSGKRETCEVEYSRFKDSSSRWLKLHCAGLPEEYKSGGPVCLCVLEDVTAAKNYEKNLVLAKDAVQAEVERRTLELRDTVEQLTAEMEERKRAEKAWQDSERRYRSLVQQLPAVVYIADITTPRVFHFLSSHLGAITGYTPEDLENAPEAWRGAIHEDDRQRIHDALKRVAHSRKPFYEEYRLNTSDGREIWLQDRASVVRGEDGADQLQGLLFDITDKKRMQEELISKTLQAEDANRAKSQFLANMSHEVRTPLNGVLGMLQLMEMNELSQQQREYLALAMKSGRSLLNIINDILDFSKIEAGKLELRQSPFSLSELVQGVLRIFKEHAASRGITLKHSHDDLLPKMVEGDEARLRQILFNLVGNAVKFTLEGEVEVLVDMLQGQSSEDGSYMNIRVKDSGVGIQQSELNAIFEPFTQIDSSFTRKHQGTGLGLGIVKRIVELMNGSIHVESTPGRGSTFTLTLPLISASEELLQDVEESLAEDASPLSILLAEDNIVNQIAARNMLEKLGHKVHVVDDGAEAIEVLVSARFDCLLLDVQMPNVDGIELTHRIRQGELPQVDSSTHIVAMTAHAMNGDRERFLEMGMDDYIAKPVEYEQLRQTLARVPRD